MDIHASLPEAPRSGDAAILDLVRLHLATVYHPGAGRAILERFSSASSAFSSARGRLREVPGVTDQVLEKLFARSTERLARDEIRRASAEGVQILAANELGYPPALLDLPAMPCLLYVHGRPDFSASAVGVVGSRRPTAYGLKQARRFSGGLARRGFVVVSGLALGIDGEAHRAALDEGGHTIAVLGSGLDCIYPPEHRDLARRMVDCGLGALVSELPLGTPPRSFHFPLRNRILSGLSAAVLVVEAGEKSGSLITVSHALDQGKPVYSVPGRVDQPECLGCLRLLLDGAAPAISPDDVLPGEASSGGVSQSDVSPSGAIARRRRTKAEHAPSPIGGRFGAKLDALFREEDSWHPDAIAERVGAPPAEVLAELSRLELDGLLRRLPGGAYARG